MAIVKDPMEAMESVLDKDSIIRFIRTNKNHLLQFGVKRIGIFGSYARNNQNVGSDIDILVEFNANQLTYDNFIALNFFLEDSFKREVDLVTIDSLSPHIGPKILQEVEYVSF
jgi:hypothetical protein